jgi:tRNA A37 N6-isopentenylltransferase MiaA
MNRRSRKGPADRSARDPIPIPPRRTRRSAPTKPRLEPRLPINAKPPPDAPRVLVIFGPTSSGKTALSLELAERLPQALRMEVEIIGADSRQVYVGMDIGTSKVGREVMLRVPHHGLDLRPPDRLVSLAEYQALALQRIREIHARGRLPLLVGGTGTYILSVIENWNVGEERLRGMENYRALGKGPTLVHAAIVCPRISVGSVMRRIDRAVERMFEAGLSEEVVGLAERYRFWEAGRLERNALSHTHGYREFLEMAHARSPVRFRYSAAELELIKASIQEHTRDYARRQWSWLKKMPPITPVAEVGQAIEAARKLLRAD